MFGREASVKLGVVSFLGSMEKNGKVFCDYVCHAEYMQKVLGKWMESIHYASRRIQIPSMYIS